MTAGSASSPDAETSGARRRLGVGAVIFVEPEVRDRFRAHPEPDMRDRLQLQSDENPAAVAIREQIDAMPDLTEDDYIGNDIPSHRFECDTEQERCAFPNGQEAPL